MQKNDKQIIFTHLSYPAKIFGSARSLMRLAAFTAVLTSFPAAAQSALPSIAEISKQPHPQVKIAEISPVVQDFAPGKLVLKSDTLTLNITRVTYTAQGVEIDAVAEQTRGSTGIVTFNHMKKGTLRDDTGTILRIRDPKDELATRGGQKGDRWKVRILTAGYLPPSAKTMTLSLHVARSHANPFVMEGSWPVPEALIAATSGAAAPIVEPGRGISYAVAPAGASPGGYLSMRVARLYWLQDGIAVDFDARNTTDRANTSLNSGAWFLRLVDDQNRSYKVVQPADLGIRALAIPHGHRMSGRLLFSPRIAQDAKRLRLLTNIGPKGNNPWAAIALDDDNMFAPKLAVDLGPIPAQALPPAPNAAQLKAKPVLASDQTLPPVVPTAVSTIDPIARLKQELGATEGGKGSTIALPGDVLFDFDKATLRADAAPTLDKLADLIRRMDRPVQVSGHTDSKGDAAYNQKLSVDRAAAVKAALVKRGIATGKIQAAGYGKERPKAANANQDGSDNPKGREINRRVEVLIPKA